MTAEGQGHDPQYVWCIISKTAGDKGLVPKDHHYVGNGLCHVLDNVTRLVFLFRTDYIILSRHFQNP